MERTDAIFAPWRMEWVQRERTADQECTFCELPTGGDDRENGVILRTEHVYVVLNNRPYNPGHSLVVPFTHEGEFHCLDDETLIHVMRSAQLVAQALADSLSPSGFNIGINVNAAGGASITDHLHMHVIPRWESDTSFMPLAANTAIIEEALDETYGRLREALLDAGAVRSDETDVVTATF